MSEQTASAKDATHWDRRRVAAALRVEQVALELFLKFGVDAVTVEEIAAAAGISQRTFFRYFPSRDDILAAAPARHLAHMVAALRARPPGEHILCALEAAVVREETLPRAERKLLPLARDLMRKEPERWMVAVRRMRANDEDALTQAITERLPGDPAMAAAMSAVLANTFRNWVAGGRFGSFSAQTERVLRAMQEMLLSYKRPGDR